MTQHLCFGRGEHAGTHTHTHTHTYTHTYTHQVVRVDPAVPVQGLHCPRREHVAGNLRRGTMSGCAINHAMGHHGVRGGASGLPWGIMVSGAGHGCQGKLACGVTQAMHDPKARHGVRVRPDFRDGAAWPRPRGSCSKPRKSCPWEEHSRSSEFDPNKQDTALRLLRLVPIRGGPMPPRAQLVPTPQAPATLTHPQCIIMPGRAGSLFPLCLDHHYTPYTPSTPHSWPARAVGTGACPHPHPPRTVRQRAR